MTDAGTRPVVVTIEEGYLQGIDAVREKLVAAGLSVETTLASVGFITGRIPAERLEGLRSIPGVVDVELDQEAHAIERR